MKCKFGHIKGTDLNCIACQRSIYTKKTWIKPTAKMLAAKKLNSSKLQSEEAKEKRAKYFSSDLHKQRARENALKLAARRRTGELPPAQKFHGTKPEIAVQRVIEHCNLNFRTQEQIGPYRFDFYLPDYQALIEVDGEYFRSLPNAIQNDLAKDSYLKSQHPNIKLLRFNEFDTLKKDFIQRVLLHALGITKLSKKQAELNQLTVSIGEAKSAGAFLAAYHYLPKFRKTMRAIHVVRCAKEIIALVIYATTSYSTAPAKYGYRPLETLELSRFVVADDWHIKNLASWALAKSVNLLKISHPEVKLLISYSDPHFGFTGTIYKAANWKTCGQTPKSYYYLDTSNSIIHKKTVWDHATKMKCSESDYAKINQLTRVDTPPKDIFIYKLGEPSLALKTDRCVEVTCQCGLQRSIAAESYKKALRKHGHYKCLSCAISKNWNNGSYKGRPRRSNIDYSAKIDVVCKCGNKSVVQLKSFNYNVKRNGNYRCNSCGVKAQHQKAQTP